MSVCTEGGVHLCATPITVVSFERQYKCKSGFKLVCGKHAEEEEHLTPDKRKRLYRHNSQACVSIPEFTPGSNIWYEKANSALVNHLRGGNRTLVLLAALGVFVVKKCKCVGVFHPCSLIWVLGKQQGV